MKPPGIRYSISRKPKNGKKKSNNTKINGKLEKKTQKYKNKF